MKRNAIVRIVLYSIATFLLSAILLAGLGVGMYTFTGSNEIHIGGRFDDISHTPEKMDSQTYIADPGIIRDIEIDWVAGSITILPGDRDTITIAESEVSDSKYKMSVKESGSKLTIDHCEDDTNFIGINKNYETKDLVIYVPMGWNCDSLEIDAASAGLEVSDMAIQEVEFDGASGICTFENCTVDRLDIDTASGDVNFSGTLEELDFDAMSACFYGTLSNIPHRLDMDSMSGDLDVTLPENCGFTLNLDAMSSDFSSDFATVKEKDAYVCGDGACRINISAMSGDVAIRKHHHIHDDNCYTENSTCPNYPAFTEHHTHSESCYAEGSTCPDYSTAHHEDSHH